MSTIVLSQKMLNEASSKGSEVWMNEPNKGWFVIYSLGTDCLPVSPDEVKCFKKLLKKAYNVGDTNIIWNHAVRCIFIDSSSKDLIIYKLGTDIVPASLKEIKTFNKKLSKAIKNNRKYLVWGGPISCINVGATTC
jgi:hypothetical protein